MKSFLIVLAVLLCWNSPVLSQVTIRAEISYDSIIADTAIKSTAINFKNLAGSSTDDSLTIYLVNSDKMFDSLAGGAIPDWGAGVAIAHRKIIVIKSPSYFPGEKSLYELTVHEYAHILLSRRIRYRPVPRWFNEGMAMYLSTEWGWRDNLAMNWASVMGRTIPLREIEKLNRFGPSKAESGYAESYLAFKYFLDTYGKSGLIIFVESIKSGRSFDRAFIAATGADYFSFEKEFSEFLAARYNLISLIFNSNLLWLILAAVIVIGFIISRIKRKSRMEKLEEYGRLHSSDFDYGDEAEKPHEDNPWD
ncbi:MAG: peptidase MA family metallohydrolase [candidate division Zixibacteria bacterium]